MSLLFFDYDGVLVDSLETEAKYFVDACHDNGVYDVNSAQDLADFSTGNFYLGMMERGVSEKKIDEILALYAKKSEDPSYHLDVFPGMPQLFQELAEKYPVYLVTSNVTESVQKVLEANGITAVREILGADVEKSKVKKFHRIMEQYPGERTVFVSDTKGDMVESKEAGIDLRLAVTWGWQAPEVVASSDYDYIFDEVKDLSAWFRGFMDAENL